MKIVEITYAFCKISFVFFRRIVKSVFSNALLNDSQEYQLLLILKGPIEFIICLKFLCMLYSWLEIELRVILICVIAGIKSFMR